MTNESTPDTLAENESPAQGDTEAKSKGEESVLDALKFFGFGIIMAPVGLGLAFLAFNMAKYNHARLPNPIAFVMMIVTGAFALLFAVAGPGVLCSSGYFLVRTIIKKCKRS